MAPQHHMALSRSRPVVLQVRALAMPAKNSKPRSARKADSRSAADGIKVSGHKQAHARRGLQVGQVETDLHNSYYMPTSAWDNLLMVDTSTADAVTEIGPECTGRYGL